MWCVKSCIAQRKASDNNSTLSLGSDDCAQTLISNYPLLLAVGRTACQAELTRQMELYHPMIFQTSEVSRVQKSAALSNLVDVLETV